MRHLFFLGFAAAVLLLPSPARAVGDETDFRITVRAKDASFIGSAMGGARVTVTDRRTGDILASGVTHGETGGTEELTAGSTKRDAVLVNDKTSSLEFSLELIDPVPVTVTATGPQSQPQATASASIDMILIPGKDYTKGNGILLDLPGLAVDVTSPPVSTVQKFDANKPVTLTAGIVKMDGTRPAPGTDWLPERYEAEALIYKDGLLVAHAPLDYGGQPGVYGQNLKFPVAGTYRLVVTVFDPVTKEAGVDETSIVLTP